MDRAHGPDRNNADIQKPPNVYHPTGDSCSTPTYDAFRDPATAPGWQNAYDDTVQLDEVVPGGPDADGAGGDGSGAAAAAGGSAAGRGRVPYDEAEACATGAPYSTRQIS